MGNSTSSALNMIQGHNITNIKNLGAVFKDVLDVDFIKEKDTSLKKLTNDSLKLPKIKSVTNTKLSNQEYMYLSKNFVNYYNENNKYRMNYLKKSFGMKYYINETHFLYFILFFCEFEDFKRSSKAQNIFFISLSKKEDFDFTSSIIFSKVLGQWGSSDILMGSENEFVKTRFIDIFKDDPIRYVLDEHVINQVLKDKGYITNNYYDRGFPEKKFKTQKPQYLKPTGPVKMKIGGKCLLVDKNNKIKFGACSTSESKFKFLDNNKIQYQDNNENKNCVAFHKNGDMTLVPCDTINVCSNTNSTQSCQTFKPRKFGGLEIVGKDRKCLSKDLLEVDCYNAGKFTYI